MISANRSSRNFYIYIVVNILFNRSPNNSRIPIDFSKPTSLDPDLSSVLILFYAQYPLIGLLEEIFEEPRSVMDTLLKKFLKKS